MTHPLTCKELVEIVTDYLEGALTPEDRARFEAHLAACQGCTAHFAQMRQTIALVGHLSEENIPEESKAELLELFRDWKKKVR
jgi:anti-sigma factor RsiW